MLLRQSGWQMVSCCFFYENLTCRLGVSVKITLLKTLLRRIPHNNLKPPASIKFQLDRIFLCDLQIILFGFGVKVLKLKVTVVVYWLSNFSVITRQPLYQIESNLVGLIIVQVVEIVTIDFEVKSFGSKLKNILIYFWP